MIDLLNFIFKSHRLDSKRYPVHYNVKTCKILNFGISDVYIFRTLRKLSKIALSLT